MDGLHGGDDVEFCKARRVIRVNDLHMLDAVTQVRQSVFGFVFAQLFVGGWIAWGLPRDPELAQKAAMSADILLWLATAATLWTGVEYAVAARKALKA